MKMIIEISENIGLGYTGCPRYPLVCYSLFGLLLCTKFGIFGCFLQLLVDFTF